VQWARGAAAADFFNTTVVKGYYKDHVKVQHSFFVFFSDRCPETTGTY
jgi:hypothetical protein